MTACGTDRGYRAHLKNGEPTCTPCRAAHNKDVKRRACSPAFYRPITKAQKHVLALRRHGMTVKAIADRSGINEDTVSAISTGRRDKVTEIVETALLGVELKRGGGVLVSRVGTVRRIQALMAIGWTHQLMKIECGHETATTVHQSGDRVTVDLADDVAAMYERLSMTPGPSKRTADRAARRGYAPPLAWDDDIDSPGAVAYRAVDVDVDEIAIEEAIFGRPVKLTADERDEAVRRMTDAGHSAKHIAAWLRVSQRLVTRKRSEEAA